MPKKPNKPKPKPKPKPKYWTLARLVMVLCFACAMESVFALNPQAASAEVNTHPYGALGVESVDDRWSNNATLGCEVTSGHVYLNGRLAIHDFWREETETDPDPVPWDQTVEVSLGLFKPDYSLLGIEADPYAGIGVARPSGPDDFSVGAEAGLEFSFGRYWGDLGIRFRDIFTAAANEVYPWDTSVGIQVGLFFGGDDDNEESDE